MTRISSILFRIIAAGILALAIPIASGYTVGDTVSDFTIPDADGLPVSLSDFKGSIVMINFWTSG